MCKQDYSCNLIGRIIVKHPRMLSAQFVVLHKPYKPKPKPSCNITHVTTMYIFDQVSYHLCMVIICLIPHVVMQSCSVWNIHSYNAILWHDVTISRKGSFKKDWQHPIHDNVSRKDPILDNVSRKDPIHDNVSRKDPIHDNVSRKDLIHDNVSRKDWIHDNASRSHFYQTRSAWSVDQGSNKNHSPAYNFAPTVTKFCNCRCKIVDSRAFPSWSLIHGLRWSGLIKAEPGRIWYMTMCP